MRARHGGDMDALAAMLGRSPDTLLDFSANVNPLGPPATVAAALRRIADDPSELSRYPDPRYAALRDVLAARHATVRERIVVGNGSAALVGAVVRALEPRRCVVAVPAFSEYAKALADVRAEAIHVVLTAPRYELDPEAIVAAAARGGATLCIVANPNNPTGSLTPRTTVAALARALERIGCALLVDEAFIDYAPTEALDAGDCTAIVLRSLTKFYAIPGVRIGYAVAPVALVERIANALPSWPVGALEVRVASAALGDVAYDERTRRTNDIERERVRSALTDAGIDVAPSRANFLFADVAALGTTAADLARGLLERSGIAVRCCDDYAGLAGRTFVRIAVRTRRENDRFLAALAERGGNVENSFHPEARSDR